MRSILVDARPGRSGRTRIESALALAREFNGHVRFLVDTPIDRFITIDGMGGSIVSAEALRDALAQDDAFADEIAARITREDVCCDIVRSDDEPVEALAAAAVLADVVVVSRADPVAGDLPLATRVAVLAVNDDRPLAFPLGRVAVGWDGSACAAQALRAAVPLLAGAVEVVILMVDRDAAEFPATDAAAYLSRHGVACELRPLPLAGTVEETLARELEARPVDLLVMGAYGHSRLREFLFGGVTRHFLESPVAPSLLLAH